MLGTQVGPYSIVRELGAGGMGAVYEARHVQLGRRVALKVLRAEIASSPEILTRFFNEARAVNHVDHPGLVQISDFGSLPDGSPYLVMELLRGETLAARLAARSRLSEQEMLPIIEQLASILAATHQSGIIHRDVKPSNIMLVPDPAAASGERVKLLDFGIAKIASTTLRGGVAATEVGLPLGTPLYMSPEQCVGASEIDGKADVYSLGVIMFELLSGHPPFQAENPLAVLNMHVSKAPPSIRTLAPNVSEATARLIQALLTKDKNARPSAAQLQLACRPTAGGQFPRANNLRLLRWSVSVTMAGATIALLYRLVGHGPVDMTRRADQGGPAAQSDLALPAQPLLDMAPTAVQSGILPADASNGIKHDAKSAQPNLGSKSLPPRPIPPPSSPPSYTPGKKVPIHDKPKKTGGYVMD